MACPACGRPQGVRLDAKTASCSCGKRIPVPRMKPLFTTDDPRELPAALGRIRAELAGRGSEFEEAIRVDPVPTPRNAKGARGPLAREAALKVLRALEEEGQGFRLSQAQTALEEAGLAASQVLEALRRENLLYESERGRYRLV